MWSPVATNLLHIVRYAVSSNITSGFSADQMYRLDRELPPGTLLPQISNLNDKPIVIYRSNVPCNDRISSLRRRKMPSKKVKVCNTLDECRSFHSGATRILRLSTFERIPLHAQRSSVETLVNIQKRISDLSQQFDRVSQQST